MIVILDMGNVGSIANMLKKIGERAVISNDDAVIRDADRMILPGVGAFDRGMERLAEAGLADAVRRHAVVRGRPLLGICLGMQLLGLDSEEGVLPGLGLIPFHTRRFRIDESATGLKVPHMGWDRVSFARPESPLLYGLSEPQRYYFVHSYHAVCDDPGHVLLRCDYGYPFTAAVNRDNIYGVQFHPEKSHQFGMALLRNFAGRC